MFGVLISITPSTTPPHAHSSVSAVLKCTSRACAARGGALSSGGGGAAFPLASAFLAPRGGAGVASASPSQSARTSSAESAQCVATCLVPR